MALRRLTPEQQHFAAALRANATDAERLLWRHLRGQPLAGMRFRRQHPIGRYFADFACVERQRIVEVDGGQHNGSDHDAERDAWLRAQGWTLLRFWNNEVMGNLEGVLVAIAEGKRCSEAQPPPRPSPLQGEGGRA